MNIVTRRVVPELIERKGGRPLKTRVGHALIKPLMKKHNAIFGGEHSGLIALLVALELLIRSAKPLDEKMKEIDPYFRSGEINSRVESAGEKIEQIAKHFSDGEQDRLDGLTVSYPEFWFNLRPSNTEPLIRLNVEANSKPLLDKKVEEILKIIRSL